MSTTYEGLVPDRVEMDRIARRRKIAQALTEQSMQPFGDTQMVGGYAVRRSPLEGFAKVAQAWAGKKMSDEADREMTAASDRKRADVASAMSDFDLSTRPRAVQSPTYEGMTGGLDEQDIPTKTEMVQPTAEGRRAAALALMGKIGDPAQVAQLVAADALKAPAGPIKVGANDRLIDPNTFRPVLDVAPPVAQPFSLSPGQIRYGPDGKQIVAAPSTEKPDELTIALTMAGIDPKSPEAQALFRQRAMKMATHQPAANTNVNVSTEKSYGQQFAGLTAKADIDLLEAARKAPDLAERANRVREVVASGKVITGAGADYRLALGKALNLVGATDAETVSNTESLSTDLAKNTLDAIKGSGLGSGSGFSNADRDFLEKAAGGKINLEAGTISRLAELSHRAAQKSAERWGSRVQAIPDSALQGTGIGRDPIKIAPLFTPQKSGAKAGSGTLTPDEQRELEELRRRFKR